jgi:hypothetical protein
MSVTESPIKRGLTLSKDRSLLLTRNPSRLNLENCTLHCKEPDILAEGSPQRKPGAVHPTSSSAEDTRPQHLPTTDHPCDRIAKSVFRCNALAHICHIILGNEVIFSHRFFTFQTALPPSVFHMRFRFMIHALTS